MPNIDENLEVALDILKSLYLDESYIVDSLFHKIDSAPNLDSQNLENIRIFLSEMRANLHELKEFGLNFFEVSSAGCKLMSHIIVDKLPSNFLRELKLLTQEEYPSLNLVLDNYGRVLKSLEKGRVKSQASPKKEKYSKQLSKQSKSDKKSSSSYNASVSSKEELSKYSKTENRVENIQSEKGKRKSSYSPPSRCKFCEGKHRMISCEKYSSPETRRKRCRELNICFNCSSSKHISNKCPAKKYGLSSPCGLCGNRAHISALCFQSFQRPRVSSGSSKENNLQPPSDTAEDSLASSSHIGINAGTSISQNILPTISINVKKGNKIIPVRMLLDLGSQHTYFNSNILAKLGIDIQSLPSINNRIKTFLGEEVRTLRTLNIEMGICCGKKFHSLPVNIDPQLDVSFEVQGLSGAIRNIIKNGYKIADNHYENIHSDKVTNIEGLLGIDAIHRLRHLKTVQCIRGSALETCHGFVPFGPVKTFLTPSQETEIFGKKSHNPSTSKVSPVKYS